MNKRLTLKQVSNMRAVTVLRLLGACDRRFKYRGLTFGEALTKVRRDPRQHNTYWLLDATPLRQAFLNSVLTSFQYFPTRKRSTILAAVREALS